MLTASSARPVIGHPCPSRGHRRPGLPGQVGHLRDPRLLQAARPGQSGFRCCLRPVQTEA